MTSLVNALFLIFLVIFAIGAGIMLADYFTEDRK